MLSDGQSLQALLDASNTDVKLLESVELASVGDDFGRFYDAKVRGVQTDFVSLENGAEAMFMRAGDLARD